MAGPVAPDPLSPNPALSPLDGSADQPLSHWHGHALVVGSGGIGAAVADALARHCPQLEVHTAGPRRGEQRLDLTDDASLQALADSVVPTLNPLRLVICTAGLLHDGALQPEKRLSQVQRSHLERSFAVNAFGPLLLAQALEARLPRNLPLHFVSFSARVGSIGDNRSGGWYSYRAAKAAQNQLLHTLALEWRRRLPLACVTLFHPGTTATGLSEPFRSGVAAQSLFSPERAATQLLEQLACRGPAQSGEFLAWDGQPIPW